MTELNQLNEAYQAYLQNDKNKTAAAKQLKIARSTYRERLDKALELFDDDETSFPRIAFWDLETSHTISAHYGQYGIDIPPCNILHPSFIICGAWKYLGSKKIHSVSLLDDMDSFNKNNFDIREMYIDDYHVVKTLHDFLSNIDILIHHNGDKFDIKKFNARALKHGLDPIGKIQCVDTLKVARKHFKIESNSLDYLCEYLGVQGKISNPRGLFLDAMLCKPEAIKKLVKYNKRDLFPSLEGVYKKLLPYVDNHPNINLFLVGEVCSKCGSRDIQEDDSLEYTRTTVKLRYRCNSCKGLSVTNKTLRRAKIR